MVSIQLVEYPTDAGAFVKTVAVTAGVVALLAFVGGYALSKGTQKGGGIDTR